MRTRHILTALALPALFAACTADEFETVNQNAGLQEERAKVAENFTLLTNGIQTRYAVEGGAGISFNFEKGDQIGAAIIDQYDPEADKPEDFEVIYSLAGNNPFEFQGNDEWKSNTQLGIGHYLFVYPYNVSDNNRAAVAYELPVIQELGEGAEGLNAAIEKGNKAVAAAVLHEGEESVDISLKNLFTYPKLTINFDNGENVTTVSQIVLKANNTSANPENAFIVKGGFNHKVLAAMFDPNEDNENLLSSDYYYAKKGATEKSMDWDKVGTYDFLIAKDDVDGSAYIPFKEGRTSDYIIVKFPEGTKVQPATNTNNKYVEARIMMPSIEKFDNNSLSGKYTLYVYTDNGVYSTAFAPSSFSFSDKTDTEKIETALARSASNGLTLKALTATNKQGDAGTIVTTLADWNDLVARFGNTKQDQTVIVVGDDFAFDATAEWPETCTFTINTDVTVKGEVAIENVTVNGAINVEKGATLTVTNTLSDREATDTKKTEIVNGGTVIIAAEYDFATFDNDQKTKVAYDGVNYIENKGTVEVAEKANAKFALNNFNEAVVENNGTMEVSNGDQVTEAGKTYQGNHGIINNNGLMRTAGFTNAEVELSKDETKIVNIPEINNAKGARILSVNGVLTNYASLVNEGELTCRNQGGTIENADDNVSIKIGESESKASIYPILDSKNGATTYITTNAANATVLVYDDDPALLTIGTQSGDVKYEAAADEKINTKDSQVNVIVANGDLTIENGSELKTLVVATGTTLTWGSAKATATSPAPKMKNLVVEKGVLTLASPDNEVTVAESLTIAEGAQMTVPEGVAFTLEGAGYENDGRILVGGAFTATEVAEDKDNVESYGDASDIEWAPTTEAQNQAKYEAARLVMAQAMILNENRESWDAVYDAIETGNWSDGGTSPITGKSWKQLAEDATDAYNTWKRTEYDYKTYVNEVFKREAKTVIEGIEKESVAPAQAAFKAIYPDNSWLNENNGSEFGVFYKKTADTKISLIQNDYQASGETKHTLMAEAVTRVTKKIDETALAAVLAKDATELLKKTVYLTLNGLTKEKVADNENWFPAYSYVCVYEDAEENDVMADLKSLKETLKGESIKELNEELNTLVNVQKAVSKLYELSRGDDLFVSTKIKATCIDEYATNVMNWKFTDKQISYLNKNVK